MGVAYEEISRWDKIWDAVAVGDWADVFIGIQYSAGLVSATVFFLTGIALLGTGMKEFLHDVISDGMNIVVGVAIVCFGVKMFLHK